MARHVGWQALEENQIYTVKHSQAFERPLGDARILRYICTIHQIRSTYRKIHEESTPSGRHSS